MTAQEEQISRIENELNGARRDLRDTMSVVNAKVEQAEEELRPDRLVEKYPVGASCLAGALGYLVGSNAKNRIVGPVVILALLGFAISKGRSKDRRSPDWRRPDRVGPDRSGPDRGGEDDDGETRADD
jgi:hypothetical protein